LLKIREIFVKSYFARAQQLRCAGYMFTKHRCVSCLETQTKNQVHQHCSMQTKTSLALISLGIAVGNFLASTETRNTPGTGTCYNNDIKMTSDV